jgi:hypothetical protein
MRFARFLLTLGAASLLTLGGCTFHRAQINVADLEQRATAVQPGRTTVAELETILGGPATSITPIGGKLLYVYTFGDSKTAGLTLILLNISKTNTAIDTALFLVDENDVVEWMGIGRNSSDVPWDWWAFGD